MKKKKTKKPDIPKFIRKALQGVTFWIGHRRCIYRDYPLLEGAIVAEMCNLLFANAESNLKIECETHYKDFSSKIDQNKRIRADIAIFEKNSDLDTKTLKYVIEVKRYSAGETNFKKDIVRLYELKKILPKIRTFLFIISEAELPSKFVYKNGKKEGFSIRKEFCIPNNNNLYYRVIKTYKAAQAFTKRKRAQYACVLEVFSKTNS